MKFTKEFLQEMEGETIYDQIVDTTRWDALYERVFKHEGRFYKTEYRRGLTEYQEVYPYEDEPDEIEVPEVFPTIKTVISYE